MIMRANIWLFRWRYPKFSPQLLCKGVCAVLILFGINRLTNRNVYTETGNALRPIVFVGGHPRSGTTLMRVMLDVHPMIRCGPETVIIPRMLFYLKRLQSGPENARLRSAKLYPRAVHSAFRAFILSLLENADRNAPVLCGKDPLSFLYLQLLSGLFPNAKFVHMIRDGRAVVASLLKRNIRINNQSLSAEEHFKRWENITWEMLRQCDDLGPLRCRTVFYENLILRPRDNMKTILEFIGVPWDPIVLHHETGMGETLLNSMEPSSVQVKYPLHSKALSSWATNESVLPPEFINSAHKRSWLLSRLGYAKLAIPPEYGIAESQIDNNTRMLMGDHIFRRLYP